MVQGITMDITTILTIISTFTTATTAAITTTGPVTLWAALLRASGKPVRPKPLPSGLKPVQFETLPGSVKMQSERKGRLQGPTAETQTTIVAFRMQLPVRSAPLLHPTAPLSSLARATLKLSGGPVNPDLQ